MYQINDLQTTLRFILPFLLKPCLICIQVGILGFVICCCCRSTKKFKWRWPILKKLDFTKYTWQPSGKTITKIDNHKLGFLTNLKGCLMDAVLYSTRYRNSWKIWQKSGKKRKGKLPNFRSYSKKKAWAKL